MVLGFVVFPVASFVYKVQLVSSEGHYSPARWYVPAVAVLIIPGVCLWVTSRRRDASRRTQILQSHPGSVVLTVAPAPIGSNALNTLLPNAKDRRAVTLSFDPSGCRIWAGARIPREVTFVSWADVIHVGRRQFSGRNFMAGILTGISLTAKNGDSADEIVFSATLAQFPGVRGYGKTQAAALALIVGQKPVTA